MEMNRLLRVLLILVWFELGVLLVLLPWSHFWESNFFLNRYPALIPLLLNAYLRGAVTGLGVIDIGMAAGAIWRRRPAPVATRS
jgi:hypothetical protein